VVFMGDLEPQNDNFPRENIGTWWENRRKKMGKTWDNLWETCEKMTGKWWKMMMTHQHLGVHGVHYFQTTLDCQVVVYWCLINDLNIGKCAKTLRIPVAWPTWSQNESEVELKTDRLVGYLGSQRILALTFYGFHLIWTSGRIGSSAWM
jgi:hypothetical protein